MKKRGKLFVMFSLVFFLTFMVSAADSKIEPLGISPGNDLGMAIVQHNCPTFSWTSVDWATGYKLVVFKADSAVVFTYGEISALQTPVLQKMIRGKALAWTPSSIEGLAPGMNYLWYVQAMDEYGTEVWSQGRSFRVELPVIPPGVEEEIRNKLKEQGMNDDNINNVFAGVGSSTAPDKTSEIPDGVAGYEGSGETYFGYHAGNGTSGTYNQSFGEYAGDDLVAGALYNSLFGRRSGENINTGDENAFFGFYTGRYVTTGKGNAAFGSYAGERVTGSYNSFFGYHAGDVTTTGWANTFVGTNAGGANTTASNNTFIGGDAGYDNTTGSDNTFIGFQTGYNNTTGYDNTFIGDMAGFTNVFGYQNTFVGVEAGRVCNGGDFNVILGAQAGEYLTSATYNTLVGYDAGDSITTGGYNTLIGEDAGSGITTGTYNVCIGANAGFSGNWSNKLYIDNSSTSTPLIGGDFTANTVKVRGNLTMENTGVVTYFTVNRLDGSTFKLAAGVANAQIGSISNHGVKFTTNNTVKMTLNANGTITMADGGSYNGTWNPASSIEFKENIRELSGDEAIDALDELNPVQYNYKKFKNEDRVGFIAEHVPELVSLNGRTNISTLDILAVLTKVVKEQQKAILELKEEINELKKDKK